MSSRKTASLTGLAVPKGQAAPIVAESVSAPAKAMPRKPSDSVQLRAITVKLTPERYRRLQLEKVDTGLSHQDIMVAAFDAFMNLSFDQRYKTDR